jgi:hypothetical protein
MTQLLLNIEDESKTTKLVAFLKTLNYISVEEINEDNIIVSESEKKIMQNRLLNAKSEDFSDWDKIKNRYQIG